MPAENAVEKAMPAETQFKKIELTSLRL